MSRAAASPINLQAFLPYRMAVVSEAISRSIAAVYAERFGLTRDEWRVLAALAERGRMASSELPAHTTLDKMQVSRALARLEADGLVGRETDAADRRQRIVWLQPSGRALFGRIVPMAQAREAYLMETLDDVERAALDRALDKLLERARTLQQQG